MKEVKRFGGILNIDDANQDVLAMQHIDATNGRFYGGANGLSFQNVKGNYLITNSSLPAGTNECIGAVYDQVKKRIIWFNRNSNGNNGIYQLLIQTGAVTKIFLCGTDSATDIFTFSLDYPVHSAAIVYRTTGDGDLLYWTDGTNRPRYLNLDTVATLSPFTQSMINAAKNAPTRPPTNTGYWTDPTVNYNAVRNKLFRFAYRWVYKSGEKSTFSPISAVTTLATGNPNETLPSNLFNYIIFNVYSPADEDYKAIEVFGQISNGNTWGDFFKIDSLDRTQYNIPVSSTYSYSFYNNGSYIFVDPQESDLYFDYLPDAANTLELLNGNVIIYAGITEGYPNLTRAQVNVTVTSSLVAGSNLSPPAFKYGCDQRFGLIYFDDRGKTNGVISFITDLAIDTTDFSVTTPQYQTTTFGDQSYMPKIQATINHTPPTWAVAYQWVRVNLTPKFIHWVTMDYQAPATDTENIYLGIENLVQMNAKNGFLPSYEFTPGDRVKILADFTGDNISTAFSVQNDFQILGVVQRTMSSPASLGAFLKIPKPASFPTPAYNSTMLIEVYTPIPRTPDNQQLFYEWGQRYLIYTSGGNRYHRGQILDQTAVQAATFSWTDGDVYLKQRPFYISVPIENNTRYSYLYMMDANWNDYVPTASNSNGRAWVINENAATVYNPVLLRWGGKYQQGTDINALNRFRPNDFDEADRAKGDIRRLKAREKILRVFQDRGVGQYGIYARFIQNNEGVPELVTTNEIITTNNINYYQGFYGLCGYPTNLCSATIADYFCDVITGREIRLSGDGMTDLGVLYKGQFFLPELVLPYNKTITRGVGSNAKVMKFFDHFENEAHTILQGGSVGATDVHSYNYSFNETRNAFCGFFDYIPEWALSADNKIYSWNSGQIYKHDSVNASNVAIPYCNWYGTQYDADITVVFNRDEVEYWLSLKETASDIWDCPTIYTDTMTYGAVVQISTLVAAEFTTTEGNPAASFKRDSNSRGGKINGDFLKGEYIVVKFRKQNASSLITLSEATVSFADSPLNLK